MNKRMPWFRAYTEMMDDEKLRLLAFEDRWHFVAILCMKGAGILDESGPLLMRKAAVKMGLAVRELDEVARRLSEVGLIDKDTLQPLAWDARQMKSDSSAERVQAYRERQKQAKQSGNVTVTTQDTDTDTDTEVEKEEEKKKATRKRAAPSSFDLPAWINRQHWDAWHSCSKRRNATDAQKQMAVNKLADWRQQGIDHAAALENAAIAGWQGLFKPDAPAAAMAPGRNRPTGETAYQRSMRERVEQAAPSIARQAPATQQDAADFFRTIDAPARVVAEVRAIGGAR